MNGSITTNDAIRDGAETRGRYDARPAPGIQSRGFLKAHDIWIDCRLTTSAATLRPWNAWDSD